MNIAELYSLFTESNSVCTDTRKLKTGDLFFALKGDQFNGNEFAEKALSMGAAYAIIDQPEYYTNDATILVEDTLKTLQELARYHRRKLKLPIVALTGSNGKTTTKELINAVLSKSFRTVATSGNLNNHIGVPLTLLSMTPQTEIGIVEMGANHLKEIEFLCTIAEPDYGYITNFGKAHLEGFGSAEGVIRGKSELYDHLRSHNKMIFYNADDKIQADKLQTYGYKFGFSTSGNADVNIGLHDADPLVRVDFSDQLISSNLIGGYNFPNIAAAATIGTYFKVAAEDIKNAIEEYIPVNNRSQIIEKNGNKIILDAYNANPSSMQVALENFASLTDSNKLAIIGDMFELGSEAEKEHQFIADLALKLMNNNVYLVGKNFEKTSSPLLKFNTFELLKDFISNNKITNSTILIKGSRGMALERILEHI